MWQALRGISAIAPDRIYAWVDPALEQEMGRHARFGTALGWFHKSPTGFKRTTSWKSRDSVAVLQLVFHRPDRRVTQMQVEMDIDLEGNVLDHATEVVVNAVGGRKTAAETVYQYLLWAGIEPHPGLELSGI